MLFTRRLIAIPPWEKKKKTTTTQTLVGFKAARQETPRISAVVVTTVRFSVRPAATPPRSQTSVCGNEKVSQMPSGGWSHFDSRPITHPQASDADGQHIWPDCLWLKLHPSIIFFNIFTESFDKTDGVLCGANNATFYNARRSAVC